MMLAAEIRVAMAGVGLFEDELTRQGVHVDRVDWRPPSNEVVGLLGRVSVGLTQISIANEKALALMKAAHPFLVGVGTASTLIEGMSKRTILHAGPPVDWIDMGGPMRGAVIGAAIYEGLALDPDGAAKMAATGGLEFVSCHDRSAVGPMAGVVSASMPMWIVENVTHGNRAFCTFNEGLGRVLRYGAFDREVQDRLHWMTDVLAPVLESAIGHLGGPIDLRSIIAESLEMGDEGHNRNRAGTLLMLRRLAPHLVTVDAPSSEIADVLRFISINDHFFLNLSMPAAKTIADMAEGIASSSIVTAMARNGTEFGLRIAGTGKKWYTAPASRVTGLLFPGFTETDGSPDIGDSTITETVGLGGLAMAAAPAIVGFIGGTPADALKTTEAMYDITLSENPHFRIPSLGFRGSPFGIDIRRVVGLGVLPVINTGIAHREPGVGQIGAGLVVPPMEAFADAVAGLADTL